MKVLRSGTQAFLLEFDDVQQVIAHHAAIRSAGIRGVVELVPAARTIFVEVDTRVRRLDDVVSQVSELEPVTVAAADQSPIVEVPVRYDGPDLADAAQEVGLSTDAFVHQHAGQLWRAAFTGFTPGFAYLVAEQTSWEVPRRREPRVSVPAGAVALAGPFTGIYPRESPGGWQIIGHTDAVLWDLERDVPALIGAGGRVRFVELP